MTAVEVLNLKKFIWCLEDRGLTLVICRSWNLTILLYSSGVAVIGLLVGRGRMKLWRVAMSLVHLLLWLYLAKAVDL